MADIDAGMTTVFDSLYHELVMECCDITVLLNCIIKFTVLTCFMSLYFTLNFIK